MKIAIFETDLSDEQWNLIQPMLPAPAKTGRPRTDRRSILNACFFIAKGGIPWRLLPPNFPPWKTVYHVFRAWSRNKTWESINDRLRASVRKEEERNCRPTAAILDSQSVKSDCHGGNTGYDAAKKIKGRKRHILVDSMGLLLGVMVTPANMPERDGAQSLLRQVLGFFKWLKKLWVDSGYSGDGFSQWVRTIKPGLEVEVVKRSDAVKGFKVLPKRWVVERTFAWLMRNRRLARDYEKTTSSAESWVYISMIRLQIRRLA